MLRNVQPEKAYQPKVIHKSAEIEDRISKRLSQSFMFKYLESNEKQSVIDAMEEKHFASNSHVIRQGEDGDVLYVVDSGELDCFKTFEGSDEPKHLKCY